MGQKHKIVVWDPNGRLPRDKVVSVNSFITLFSGPIASTDKMCQELEGWRGWSGNLNIYTHWSFLNSHELVFNCHHAIKLQSTQKSAHKDNALFSSSRNENLPEAIWGQHYLIKRRKSWVSQARYSKNFCDSLFQILHHLKFGIHVPYIWKVLSLYDIKKAGLSPLVHWSNCIPQTSTD